MPLPLDLRNPESEWSSIFEAIDFPITNAIDALDSRDRRLKVLSKARAWNTVNYTPAAVNKNFLLKKLYDIFESTINTYLYTWWNLLKYILKLKLLVLSLFYFILIGAGFALWDFQR